MTTSEAATPAPDAELRTDSGAPVRLSSLWAEKPLVLAFLPPVASPFCTDNAAQLRDDDLLHAAGALIIAVVAGSPTDAMKVRQGWRTDFPIHCDEARQAFEAYGLVVREVVQEEEVEATRPGTFVIATDGRLHFVHRGAAVSDYPPIGQILPHVSALTGIHVEPPAMTALEPAVATQTAAAASGGGGYTGPPIACVKCGSMQFSTSPISTSSGLLSRIFNLQHRRFTALTCEPCGYTELYREGSSALANVADVLVGS